MSTTTTVSAAIVPAPLIGMAAIETLDTNTLIGGLVGLSVSLLLLKWMMTRDDKRQAFAEKQSEARDALLQAQASQLTQQTVQLTQQTDLLRTIAERLGAHTSRLEAIERRCGTHPRRRPETDSP
jgi:hypothetical protein